MEQKSSWKDVLNVEFQVLSYLTAHTKKEMS